MNKTKEIWNKQANHSPLNSSLHRLLTESETFPSKPIHYILPRTNDARFTYLVPVDVNVKLTFMKHQILCHFVRIHLANIVLKVLLCYLK